MWEVAERFKVKLGGNYFINCKSLISCNDEWLFRLYRRDSDGHLGIDFDVYDSSGNKIATVRNSNVVDGDPSAYRIAHGATQKTITEAASGRVIVKIDKEPPDAELAVSVDMFLPNSGFRLIADEGSIQIPGFMSKGSVFANVDCGIAIGGSRRAGVRLQLPRER